MDNTTTYEQTLLLRRTDVAAAGMALSVLDQARRRKWVTPIQRGIYLIGDREPVPIELARAAAEAIAPFVSGRFAVSHTTAALVHGLDVPAESGVASVTIPRSERRPHRESLEIHTAKLTESDICVVEGVPVTSVARTLVDLCRSMDAVSALWALESGIRERLVTADELAAVMRRMSRSPGLKQVRHLIAAVDPRSQSQLETRARLAMIEGGIPVPESQIEVPLPNGRTAFLDFGYREHRVGIELDGSAVHGTPAAVYRDRWRQNQLQLLDWRLLRFTHWDFTRRIPQTLAEIRAALDR
ncbi:DUF559 domain-containing protein [Pseudonocardiaceae bacterium YIM PH 21723]|nr:DUF559 domain-containing protein [Pseudonocardiaceae bacterium YIM PH 21723]